MSEITQPASFRVEEGAEAAAEQLIMVLDLQAALPGVRRLRAWAREALGARPGERAVDIGSGTGDELQALAAAVGPSGAAIGVEPNSGLRAEATRRATEAGSAATFVDGDAYALPFADASVDVARCERVWQHLDSPERAAAEIARVLRPGGRVTLIDTDWATAVIHPGDPEVVERLHRFWLSRFPNPLSGRRLTGQLTAAGLVVDDLGSQALIQDASAIDTLMTMTGALALADGIITELERDQLMADLRAGATRGDFHFSVTMFGVLAHKPNSPPA